MDTVFGLTVRPCLSRTLFLPSLPPLLHSDHTAGGHSRSHTLTYTPEERQNSGYAANTPGFKDKAKPYP